jgi:hypothetical protein
MNHCDSAKEIEKREDEGTIFLDAYFECSKCNSEQNASEETLRSRQCRECETEHLEKNMFQKLIGWLCYSCANEYETKLMKATA